MTKKVIIIDDSTTVLNLLKTIFAKNFWEVYDAKTASSAYEMIFDIAPDLIITDAIMPVMGGFQLIKNIKDNNKISKIPVIVYSVLPEKNAKFYVKEDLIEYFLTKDDNYDELIDLAEKITAKFPLSASYKEEILKTNYINEQKIEEIKELQKIEDEEIQEEKIDTNAIREKFREIYNFELSDERLFSEIFSILYPILKYDLFIISPSLSNETYFDIRDIILSPIFQNAILDKYDTEEIVLFKKYAPNLKMIVNEEEFNSKIELNFESNNIVSAKIAFYSETKNKWQDKELIEEIKNILFDFFKARHLKRITSTNKKETITDKYFTSKFDLAFLNNFEPKLDNAYVAIVEISNFSDFKNNLSQEELDVVNSKISEKIINYLNKDEQIYKNDEDEYIVVVFAKDNKQATYKLNCISNFLSIISYNDYFVEPLIGASNCSINGIFNIYEAQKIAREALNEANSIEKTVVK